MIKKQVLAGALALTLIAGVATAFDQSATARNGSDYDLFTDTVGEVRVVSGRSLPGDGLNVELLPNFQDTSGNVTVLGASGLVQPGQDVRDVANFSDTKGNVTVVDENVGSDARQFADFQDTVGTVQVLGSNGLGNQTASLPAR